MVIYQFPATLAARRRSPQQQQQPARFWLNRQQQQQGYSEYQHGQAAPATTFDSPAAAATQHPSNSSLSRSAP